MNGEYEKISDPSESPPDLMPTFRVGEIARHIKLTLEDRFHFIRVRGEISGAKRHSSGHLYFSLKDEEAVLDAVSWRGTAQRLPLQPRDGLEVICTGRITTYPGRSKYQMIVDRMELAGEGVLLKLLEDRKKKLAAEGLFALERKKPLPFLPRLIGIITSPTGAVIRDILHRLEDRMPTRVLLWPVLVQGEDAADQITRAIEGFNNLQAERPDLLIVARGGGSLEDLWAFNEENVVRAAATSDIPLISAIGHETDTTLVDYAADWRAPTPTAAAEKAVPVKRDLLNGLSSLGVRLKTTLARLLEEREMRFDDWSERFFKGGNLFLKHKEAELRETAVRLQHPRQRLGQAELALKGLHQRLAFSVETYMNKRSQQVVHLAQLLKSYSFEATLKRGFALVRREEGPLIPLAAGIHPGQLLRIEFQDGNIKARAEGKAQGLKKISQKRSSSTQVQSELPFDQ